MDVRLPTFANSVRSVLLYDCIQFANVDTHFKTRETRLICHRAYDALVKRNLI
jgi:hypothetical protein